jgi:hypothetical protein
MNLNLYNNLPKEFLVWKYLYILPIVVLYAFCSWFGVTSYAAIDPVYLPYYTVLDPVSDINMDADYAADPTYLKMITAFSYARSKDPSVLPAYKTLKISPDFKNLTGQQQFLSILNHERMARGLIPIRKEIASLRAVAQGHSDNMSNKNEFAHNMVSTDGVTRSPFQRIDNIPALKDCHEYHPFGESLALFDYPNYNITPFLTGQNYKHLYIHSIYLFLYQDASEGWGHRHHLLSTMINNNTFTYSEGLAGIAMTINKTGAGPKIYITYNTIDPKPDCIQ